MGKGKIAAIVGVLIFLGLGIYWKLGGFNTVRFSIEELENLTFIGLTYRGTPQDDGMVETFRKIEDLLNGNPNAHLHTIYYTEPAGKLDTLQVFVGIEYIKGMVSGNELEIKKITCSQIIVADIKANRLVMPNPERVKKDLEAFAIENGVVTQGIYIDKIIKEDKVEVIAPLK